MTLPCTFAHTTSSGRAIHTRSAGRLACGREEPEQARIEREREHLGADRPGPWRGHEDREEHHPDRARPRAERARALRPRSRTPRRRSPRTRPRAVRGRRARGRRRRRAARATAGRSSVLPSPYTVSSSRLGRPFSHTSRPVTRLSQLSLTSIDGGKIRRKIRANPARRTIDDVLLLPRIRRPRLRPSRSESCCAGPVSTGRGSSTVSEVTGLFVGVDRAFHKPVLVRDARRLGPVLNAELAVDVRQVELHRLRGYPELLRDLVVREPAGERAQDRQLAVGEAERLRARLLALLDARPSCGCCPRAPAVASPAGRPGFTVLTT